MLFRIIVFLIILAVPVWSKAERIINHNTYVVRTVRYPAYGNLGNISGFGSGMHVDVKFNISQGDHQLDTLFSKVRLNKDKDPNGVIIIFLTEASGFDNKVEKAITKYGLEQWTYKNEKKKDWPDANYLRTSGKTLLIFSDSPKESPYWHNTKDYIYWLPYSELYSYQASYPDNKLILVDHTFKAKESPSSIVTGRTEWIKYYVDFWNRIGKKPNFIHLRPDQSWLGGVAGSLNSMRIISGNIHRKSNMDTIPIRWGDSPNKTSGNRFSFAAYSYGDTEFMPRKIGLKFNPEKITVPASDNDTTIVFWAERKALDEDMTVYYPLDGSWTNQVDGKKLTTECTFAKDEARGEVADFRDDVCVTLGNVEDLGITNSSFTIGVWVKFFEKAYHHPILCTEKNKYLEGLQFMLREHKPYLGFYSSDLKIDTKLNQDEWNHLVWSYNKESGDQRLFLNGVLMASTFGHLPFMGTGNLLFGKRDDFYNPETKHFLNGYMDDLCIWRRALSESDVKQLYMQSGKVETSPERHLPKQESNFLLITGILAVSVIGLIILGVWKYRKNEKDEEEQHGLKINEKNVVRLFGFFQVLDRNGNDISDKFTPKLKALFLTILLYSHKYGQGISIKELNEVFWPDLPPKKASNNRNVNIKRIKDILKELDGIELVTSNRQWRVAINDKITHCDYSFVLKLLTESDLNMDALSVILKRGGFLPKTELVHLDQFKSEVTNRLLDVYEPILRKSQIGDVESLVIANIILSLDPLNEPAMLHKVETHRLNNRESRAKKAFETFRREYAERYGEDYKITL